MSFQTHIPKSVEALAEHLWSVAYAAACRANPERYWNSVTWNDEKKVKGRAAAWRALARYWKKGMNLTTPRDGKGMNGKGMKSSHSPAKNSIT